MVPQARRSARRWFRIACVTYDSYEYETYFGRLGTRQRHPNFRSKDPAMRYAERELRTLGAMGLPSKIWAPLARHADSGHIHIVVLTTYRRVRRLFPSEEAVRRYGRLAPPR